MCCACCSRQLTAFCLIDGWVYTDDMWMNPSSAPRDAWMQTSGLTRRRRWVRRIYYDPAAAK